MWHLAYLAQNVNLIDGGTNLYPLQTEALLSGISALLSGILNQSPKRNFVMRAVLRCAIVLLEILRNIALVSHILQARVRRSFAPATLDKRG